MKEILKDCKVAQRKCKDEQSEHKQPSFRIKQGFAYFNTHLASRFMDALPVFSAGQSSKPPATENPNKMEKSNKEKGVVKKRKAPRKKAANKAPKRPRRQNEGLKASPPVDGFSAVNPSNHGSVLADVSKGRKKRRKKPGKKNEKKVIVKKQKRKPAESTKGVSKGNLDIPAQELTDNLFREESGDGLDGPRKGDNSSNLGNFGGSEVAVVHQEISHNGDRELQKEPKGEIAQQHVPVANQVLRLINWEHFGLIFEEHCMCTDLSKR